MCVCVYGSRSPRTAANINGQVVRQPRLTASPRGPSTQQHGTLDSGLKTYYGIDCYEDCENWVLKPPWVRVVVVAEPQSSREPPTTNLEIIRVKGFLSGTSLFRALLGVCTFIHPVILPYIAPYSPFTEFRL